MLSSDTFDIALDVASPDTTVDLATFLRPPPEVSTAKNTSSLAIVEISDKSPTAKEYYMSIHYTIVLKVSMTSAKHPACSVITY